MDSVGLVRVVGPSNGRKSIDENTLSSNGKSTGFSLSVSSDQVYIETTAMVQIIDVTDHIREALGNLNVWTGNVSLQSLHTTVGLFLNECQEALLTDVEEMLELLAPQGNGWRHNDPKFSDCERRNAHAHLRAILLGQTLSLQVNGGNLLLGEWQRLLFAEMDGPRKRTLQFQFVGQVKDAQAVTQRTNGHHGE